MTNKTDKTPTRAFIGQQVNDENKPINSKTKSINSKQINKSNSKYVNSAKHTNNQANGTRSPDRKQIKTNLVNKINNAKNPLASRNQLVNDKQEIATDLISAERRLSNEKSTIDRPRLSNERRLSNEKLTVTKTAPIDRQLIRPRLSNERRLSNEKLTVTKTAPIDRQLIRPRLSNERRLSNEKLTVSKTVPIDKQSCRTNDKQMRTTDKVQLKSTICGSNDKLNQAPNHQYKQSDRPTKLLAINLNEDQPKSRLTIENELLRLKYLNVKCESKLRRQQQTIGEIVKTVFHLIGTRQECCLQLKQQLVVKESLAFLAKLSEESVLLLRGVDVKKLEIYLALVSNIINSALSSVKVIDLKNGQNINGKCRQLSN